LRGSSGLRPGRWPVCGPSSASVWFGIAVIAINCASPIGKVNHNL
jgi:hypothetical protein